MAHQFVVGLFESRGIAEDAFNRLKHEGVPAQSISLLLLHQFASSVPQAVTPELEALSVDPLVLGDVRETYAPLISNGETALFVKAASEPEVDFAAAIIKLYAPIRIRVVAAGEGAPISRDLL